MKRPSVSKEKGEPNRSRGESRGLSIAEGEVTVSGARGNAPTSRHGARSTPGKAGCGIRCSNRTRVNAYPKVRSERSPRGRARRLPTEGGHCNPPPRVLGVEVFQRPTPPGAARKRDIQTGCFESHRGYTQSSHRLQISSSKCRAFPRDKGDARCSRCSPRATYGWVRRELRSRHLGEGDHPQTRG